MHLLSYHNLYPYLFLLGNCLIWYGTAEIHYELLFSLVLVPFLLNYRIGKLPAVLILGCCFAEFSAISQQQWKFPESQSFDNHLLTGSIEGLPEHQGNMVRLGFTVFTINHQPVDANKKLSFRLACYQKCPDFRADQSWQLLVRLKPPNGYLNPQGFDYEKWLYAEQFKATGYIVLSNKNKIITSRPGINSLRQTIRNYFIENISDPAVRGSAIALTLGDKSHLQKQHQQILADNGLSHLLAISGLHIGLSAIPGFLLAGFIWRRIAFFQRYNCTQFQWLICLVPAIGYTIFSGFGLPAMRALVMLLVFVIVHLCKYSMSTHSRFSLALWIILLTQSLAPLQLSFWLSFCATAILIFLSQFFQSRNPLISLIKLQSQLFILLMPIQLLIFGSISLFSPLLNFFAIPFVSVLLLPSLLLLMIFIVFSLPGTDYLLWLAEQLLRLFWSALSAIAPYTETVQYSSSELNYLQLLLYPLLLTLLISVHLRVKAIILLMLFLLQLTVRSSLPFRMMVLDVGQGLAVSINYRDKLLIYDTAYGSPDFTVADMTLLPWLNSLSISTIDILVISHNDADHSGGTQLLMDNYPVHEIISGSDVKVPTVVKFPPYLKSRCYQGQSWQWQELSIRVLSPMFEDNLLKEGNDSSCVLLLEINEIQILLTGDIGVAAEQQLIKNYPELSANILLVPHHGSKTSSSWSFLGQIKPQLAIITSGYLNRYNLPEENIVQRYNKNAIKMLNTAYSGAIEITINDQGNVSIKQWRLDNQTLWRRH